MKYKDTFESFLIDKTKKNLKKYIYAYLNQ